MWKLSDDRRVVGFLILASMRPLINLCLFNYRNHFDSKFDKFMGSPIDVTTENLTLHGPTILKDDHLDRWQLLISLFVLTCSCARYYIIL